MGERVCLSAGVGRKKKEKTAEQSFIASIFTLDYPTDSFIRKQTVLPKHCGRRPNGETIKREAGTGPCQGLIGSGSEKGSRDLVGAFWG